MTFRRKGWGAFGAFGAAAALMSTALWAGVGLAETVPGAVTLTGSTIQATAGSNVTFTAQAVGVTNPEYQFWVELPNGNWVDEQNYSSSGTFVLKNVQAGNYLVAVDVMTPAQIQAGDWSQAVTTLADGVFVGSNVSLSLSATNLSAGETVTATASASEIYDPLYQFWWETPDGVWHQSGNYSASATFKLPAFTEQGAIEVVAYAKSPLAVNDPEGALISNVVKGTASLSTITATPSGAVTGTIYGISATFDQNGTTVYSETLPAGDYSATTNMVSFAAPSSSNLPAGTYSVTVTIEAGSNGNFVTCAPVTFTQG